MVDAPQASVATATTSQIEQLFAFTIMERLTNNPGIPRLFQSQGLLTQQPVAHSGYTTSSWSVTPGYQSNVALRQAFIDEATTGDYKISNDQAEWIFDNFSFDSFNNRTNNLFTPQSSPFGAKVDLAYRRINTPLFLPSYIDVVFSGTTAQGMDLQRVAAIISGFNSAYYSILSPDWLSSIAARASADELIVRPNTYSQGGYANGAIVDVSAANPGLFVPGLAVNSVGRGPTLLGFDPFRNSTFRPGSDVLGFTEFGFSGVDPFVKGYGATFASIEYQFHAAGMDAPFAYHNMTQVSQAAEAEIMYRAIVLGDTQARSLAPILDSGGLFNGYTAASLVTILLQRSPGISYLSIHDGSIRDLAGSLIGTIPGIPDMLYFGPLPDGSGEARLSIVYDDGRSVAVSARKVGDKIVVDHRSFDSNESLLESLGARLGRTDIIPANITGFEVSDGADHAGNYWTNLGLQLASGTLQYNRVRVGFATDDGFTGGRRWINVPNHGASAFDAPSVTVSTAVFTDGQSGERSVAAGAAQTDSFGRIVGDVFSQIPFSQLGSIFGSNSLETCTDQ